jgi:hypothetical protein
MGVEWGMARLFGVSVANAELNNRVPKNTKKDWCAARKMGVALLPHIYSIVQYSIVVLYT